MSELLNFIIDHEEAFKSSGRLASLYSDFRVQQATNPDGYQANISAWRRALIDASRAGLIPSQGAAKDLLVLRTGEELARALESKRWGRPLALGAVIQDAVARREMIPLKDFMAAKTSIYQRSWAISPWQVMSWSLRQLGLVGSASAEDKLVVSSFVVMANVEAAASAILSRISAEFTSSTSLIHSYATFNTAFSHVLNPTESLSQTDLTILLTHLFRDKAALTYSPTTQTIKFAVPGSTPAPITQQDVTIARLRTLIASLQAQLPALTARVQELDSAARAAVASKQTVPAKNALRSKKLAAQALARRADTLAQLEEVFAAIEAAADQVEVVQVMEGSAGVLRSLHKEVGGVEGVEGVVEALREEMGRLDEVGGVLAEVGRDGVVDEMEVEEEFERLERREKEAREEEAASKTRERLGELDRLDKPEEVGKVQEQQTPGEAEKGLEESMEGLGKMSLDEARPVHTEEQRSEEGQPAS